MLVKLFVLIMVSLQFYVFIRFVANAFIRYLLLFATKKLQLIIGSSSKYLSQFVYSVSLQIKKN